jgi:hypothetical protein
VTLHRRNGKSSSHKMIDHGGYFVRGRSSSAAKNADAALKVSLVTWEEGRPSKARLVGCAATSLVWCALGVGGAAALDTF